MANHSYLKRTDKPMRPDDIDSTLRRIVDTHFDGAFKVERWDNPQGELDAWTFFLTERDGFQLWLNDEHNLEAPHSFAWANAFHWVQDVILCLLRESFGGTIHDDGIGDDELLFPDCDSSGIYPFRKWWERIYGHFDGDIAQRMWDTAVLGGPDTAGIMDLLRLGNEEYFDK